MFAQSQLVWEYIHHTMLKTKPYIQNNDERKRHLWCVYLYTHILMKCVYISQITIKALKYK